MDNQLHIGGLKKPTIDLRDFSHKKYFGAGELPTVDFDVNPNARITDQGTTDFCVPFSTTSCSEDQETPALSPEYIAHKIIKPDVFGAEIRSGAKAHCDFGCIEQSESPVRVPGVSRAEVLNEKNWRDKDYDALASKHKKLRYFRVDNLLGSKFDAIRSALWMHKEDKRSIFTGAIWYREWTYAAGGVVPKRYSERVEGHAFKVRGQKHINGEPYLVIQNSGGTDYGNRGLWYFPREVVDSEFYPAYMFVDVDEEKVVAVQKTLIEKLKQVIQLYIILITRNAAQKVELFGKNLWKAISSS